MKTKYKKGDTVWLVSNSIVCSGEIISVVTEFGLWCRVLMDKDTTIISTSQHIGSLYNTKEECIDSYIKSCEKIIKARNKSLSDFKNKYIK